MDRRRMVSLSAASLAAIGLQDTAGAATQVPAIRRVEAFPANYPVTAFFRFFTKPERPTIMVKITLEDGTVGWGQSVPSPAWSYETPESVLSAIRDYLAAPLIGSNPLDIQSAHQKMNRVIAPSFSTGMPIAKAGVDLALHDIAGKLAGRTLPELWGRKAPEKITLSWTVNVKEIGEAERVVAEGRANGYKHFNLKVAPDPIFDLELARTVRKLAPACFLWADANGGYDPATALAVAPKLADAGVDVLEQPVAANRLSAFRELKQQGALPILMDEGVVSSTDLMEFIRLGLLDGVAMKPARTAGLWDARKQVQILEDAGLLFLGSGLTDPDVSLAATLHLYAAYGLKFPAALNGKQFLKGSFLKSPIRIEDGEAFLPIGPGLGVDVDETRIMRGEVAGA
ncbi:MAG: enolase C-terminal domain-like protein [Bryobacterales bacterium]|nr:enolase C-terminal domain-like protein [Bryobacterales bacterium]